MVACGFLVPHVSPIVQCTVHATQFYHYQEIAKHFCAPQIGGRQSSARWAWLVSWEHLENASQIVGDRMNLSCRLKLNIWQQQHQQQQSQQQDLVRKNNCEELRKKGFAVFEDPENVADFIWTLAGAPKLLWRVSQIYRNTI